ncbi:MAG: HlyD family type I secretion periplasmic adaptor subunit, partial [Gammaproteobacteria bacterium]
MTNTTNPLALEALDFAPAILALQERPPSPLPRTLLYTLLALCACLLIWAAIGKLDIIAVAEGKLVPQTYVKIVQPAESGILRQILVNEGDEVMEGQTLMRLDTELSEADINIVSAEIKHRELQLRRIDAELSGEGLYREADDATERFRHVDAQYRAHRRAYRDALAEERAALTKAKEELGAAGETRKKLQAVLPSYQQEEAAWVKLGEKALAGHLQVLERRRARIETEQDLRAQERTVGSLKAAITQSENRLAQITSRYQEQLHNERIEAQAELDKLQQEGAKQRHKNALLALKAPQAGIIKDLATHTLGAVVSPGTVLMTLVPSHEALRAEVMVKNEDVGFVHQGQPAKIKMAPYPFQKYGLIEGRVVHVSADANDAQAQNHGAEESKAKPQPSLTYKAIIELNAQVIERDGRRYTLTPGMHVVAEIHQGSRTVLEYLLSPVRGVLHEAMRER